MECLVNKRVRLKNSFRPTFLVACSDKETVTQVSFHEDKPKPENTVWVIKGKNPNKSVRLESVYGKVLGCKKSKNLTVCQVDKKAAEGYYTWWTLEDVDSALTCVKLNIHCAKVGVYLYGESTTPCIKMSTMDFSWWSSWLGAELLYQWNLQIVDTPTTSEDQTGTGRAWVQQVEHMHVRNIYKNSKGTPLPFGNFETGGNVNGSGTQIVGGVNVQTQIDNSVHKTIVRRDNLVNQK